MEIRRVISNNKTGEILEDCITEIPDDEIAQVVGGVARLHGALGSQEAGKFTPTHDKFTATSGKFTATSGKFTSTSGKFTSTNGN